MALRLLRRIQAARDVEAIADFIAQDSLETAVRFLENTEATLRRLADCPSIGVPFSSGCPELADLRICRIKGFPNHVIFFIARVDAIDVVRILHGARDVETELRRI